MRIAFGIFVAALCGCSEEETVSERKAPEVLQRIFENNAPAWVAGIRPSERAVWNPENKQLFLVCEHLPEHDRFVKGLYEMLTTGKTSVNGNSLSSCQGTGSVFEDEVEIQEVRGSRARIRRINPAYLPSEQATLWTDTNLLYPKFWWLYSPDDAAKLVVRYATDTYGYNCEAVTEWLEYKSDFVRVRCSSGLTLLVRNIEGLKRRPIIRSEDGSDGY